MKKTIIPSDLPIDVDNILSIEDADAYVCTVMSYIPDHPVLVIRAYIPTGGKYILEIVFENIKYFEGTFGWGSANFRLAGMSEYFALFKKIRGWPTTDDESFDWLIPQPERLFLVGTLPVKIIANVVHVEVIEL
jgi:hypothetical protein